MEEKNRTLSWSEPSPKPPQPAAQHVPLGNDTRNTSASLENDKKTMLWYSAATVAIIVVLVLTAWNFMSMESAAVPLSSEATSTQDRTQAMNALDGSVEVASQTAGFSVEITNITANQPVWLVVYESRNGRPGNVLGAALFYSQQNSGKVELLRSTRAGETYFVGTSIDNGDRKFSLTSDRPVLNNENRLLLTEFVAY